MKEQKWGYGGTETALSGLVKVIMKALNPPGLWNDRCEFCYKIIIQYAKETNIQGPFKGHAIAKANRISKIIQNDFRPFRDWVYALRNKKTPPDSDTGK